MDSFVNRNLQQCCNQQASSSATNPARSCCPNVSKVACHPSTDKTASSCLSRQLDKLHFLHPHEIVSPLSALCDAILENVENVRQECDVVLPLLKVLSRVLMSDSQRQKITSLMEKFLDSNLFEVHIPKLLIAYSMKQTHPMEVLRNLLVIFRWFLMTMPVTAAVKLGYCITLCARLRKQIETIPVPPDIKVGMEFVENALHFVLEQIDANAVMEIDTKEENKLLLHRSSEIYDTEVASNFRHFPIIPTAKEITTNDVESFLSKSFASDVKSKDINCYLEIQFRLLREEFVVPLSLAIATHVGTGGCSPFYSGVKIEGLVYKTSGLLYEISFDVKSAIRNFGFQVWHRLQLGSLLCLSADNFHTILYATVSQRDPSKLKNGKLTVKFEREDKHTFHLGEEERSYVYEMVESSTNFEVYRSVTKGIQRMNSKSMPLREYIVDLEKNVDPPLYLKHTAVYDLSCVCLGNTHQQIKATDTQVTENCSSEECSNCSNVYVLDFREWPTCEELNLDSSQKRALQFALTSSLAIIRGQPGTGKTYLAKAIVRTLLHNQKVWKSPTETARIFLIFSSTHALDQFIGELKYESSKVVRIAGRSAKENMDRYDISNCLLENKSSIVEVLKRKLSHIKGRIEEQEAKLLLLAKNIIHENQLEELSGADKKLLRSLTNGFDESQPENKNWSPKSLMAAWLGLSFDYIVDEDDIEHFLWYPEDDGLNVDECIDTSNDVTDEKTRAGSCSDVIDDMNYVLNDDGDSDSQLLDKDSDFILSLPIPICREAWAVHVHSLENPFDHFPEEKALDGAMIPLYLAMGRARKVIAEREMKKINDFDDIVASRISDGNVWLLSLHHRWCLYRRWVRLFRMARIDEIRSLKNEYDSAAGLLKNTIQCEKLVVLLESDIIATTIAAAARNQQLLQKTGSKIAIVQEASEILESHLIATLPSSTEHLILIGDFDPRPTTIVSQEKATYSNFGDSLFERLIQNGMQHETLEFQHRMCPEISSIISPLLYPELKNDTIVQQYRNIKGLSSNVFFINHNFSYNETGPESSGSEMEAGYLLGLCEYLIHQGYEPYTITVLTFCAQQLYIVRNLLIRETLNGVKATMVHAFKEENDIVLVSAASKTHDKDTLLECKSGNDIVMAMTRARKGFYCFGNFSQISNDFCQHLIAHLHVEKPESVGSKLELKCQTHPNSRRFVTRREDFKIVAPNGGCLQICSLMQPCGHFCQQLCHLDGHSKCSEVMKVFPVCNHTVLLPCSQDIAEVKCTTNVQRVLNSCGHKVELECHVDVNLYKCTVKVKHVFPQCGHHVEVNCSAHHQNLTCQDDCDYRLDCGHKCPRACHVLEDTHHLEVLCTKPCQRSICKLGHKCSMRCCEPCNTCFAIVQKELLCGHRANVFCFQDMKTIAAACWEPCTRILACGHPCRRLCGDVCGGCEVIVEKIILNCLHPVKVKCLSNPLLLGCVKPHRHVLSCGHVCTSKCCDPCIQKCKQLARATFQPCGHTCTVPCHYTERNSQMCRSPCGRLLPCKHECKGTCGECRQGRVHVPCSEKCDRIQICGHECDTPCSEACMPCKRTCQNRCLHSRCRKRCGLPCVPCLETCEWCCPHFRCDKTCDEFCTRPRCNEPCTLLLNCGHTCIGLCGERCPNLCRICNSEELTEFILYGFEDEKDSRFIQLEDCGHCIEVRALDHWMDMDDGAIQMKSCPRCRTTIWRCLRYGNVIRSRMLDVQKVKEQIFGSSKTLKDIADQLLVLLAQVNSIQFDFHDSVAHLQHRLTQPTVLHQNELVVIENQINMLELMMKIKEKTKNMTADAKDDFLANMKLLGKRLMQNEERITEYELNQINCEIRRIFLIAASKDTEAKIRQRSNSLCTEQLTRVKQILDHGCALTEAEEKEIEGALETALRLQGGLGISYQERVNIVTAMGFQQGHWFKCPNGHIYAIGECGGAMQVSNCNECGAQIGGQGHQLLTDNAFAGEMDGSRNAAWPSTANP